MRRCRRGRAWVEIDLIEQPDGTLLRLTHTGLPNAAEFSGHAEGWADYLGRLAEVRPGTTRALIPSMAALAGTERDASRPTHKSRS